MTQEFFPSEWNDDMIHRFNRNQLSSGMPLNGANMEENVVEVLALLKSSFYCFRCRYNRANQNQSRYVRLLFETLVKALDPSMSNEPYHHFSISKGAMSFQIQNQFRDSPPLSPPSDFTINRNVLPLSFVDRDNIFGMVVHQIRSCSRLWSTSFLNTWCNRVHACLFANSQLSGELSGSWFNSTT